MDVPHTHIALFLDTENLAGWLKHNGVEHLIDELSEFGLVTIRQAFGNWGGPNLQGFQDHLNEQGFDFVHTFHPVSGKNSADIAMTIEVMKVAQTSLDVDWFVLATGDSDFSPLFREIRSLGKHVVGVGPHSPLSESVKRFCARYFYTDQQNSHRTICPPGLEGAIHLTRSVLQESEQPLNCSVLKNRILSVDEHFDEKRYGFSSFSEFIQAINGVDTRRYGDHQVLCARLSKRS
ncbi:NYN domain-containing protein [Endozoicomonas montiporae]|uniref:HTH OST-type domain-containing protein n=1 Tax=Endozoicomonas montiporae CL-33 TaxID=570277 RepID=A0A142BDE1_9GAMM|nr:NYN domain-containing protein [Endozoicomonas montiporae]AMO56767.1 hypothetical protein EZMO1_2710 [Endozoicomonas montiporae CL-33]